MMMTRRYVTVDVFTDRQFGGNQLAVVLQAEGMSTAQMQSVAAEFGYAETTFVLPPADPAHTAQVRIFTPRSELRFAGHPNVGTACVLAWEREMQAESLMFEELAGLVPMQLLRRDGRVIGAELTAPETLSLHAEVALAEAAACLSLDTTAIQVTAHRPRVVSVGMKFLMIEVVDDAALAAARANHAAHAAVLPLHGALGTYGYVREGNKLRVRMFAPLQGIAEDSATGAAAASIVALLMHLDGRRELHLTIEQGVFVDRPSLLQARAHADDDGITAHVGGRCVMVMQGSFALGGP